MSADNPFFRELDQELTALWNVDQQQQLALELTQLSQQNQLQHGLADRLHRSKSLIQLRLLNSDWIIGQVVQIGVDAVLLKTSLTYQLIPLASISYLLRAPKARSINPTNRKIMTAQLIHNIGYRISIDLKTGDQAIGELVSVWQDCLDLNSVNQIQTIPFFQILKLELN